MVFENGRDRDILNAATPEKVTITDDFGRELTFRPMNVQTTLLQDVDKAAEGNLIANVKNNVAQALGQVRSQAEVEKNPEMKSAMMKAQLTQGMQPNGMIRS